MTDTPPMIATLAEALAKRGYDQLTPVQEAVTRPELAEADLLVSAQTGSGKTVGFGLAIAPTLLEGDGRFPFAASPLALVIAPTRELALQVKRELGWLYEMAGAVVASCVGGMDMRDERRALDRGAHIVVATPGRLRDHIQRGSLDMTALRAVVLDEADEMLDLGFREDLEFILGEAPDSRRTLMFSATVPKSIAALAQGYLKNPVRVTTAGERSQHADIEYRALNVVAADTENAIVNVLRFYEAQNAIIFCNTRVMVNRLTTRLSNRSFSVVALSGELSQTERSHALQAMRDGRARVCVATDVAARGIDLPNLELVIHADLPTNAETLLHRSGRTGRAGRKGVSALIVARNSRKKAENLLRYAKVTAEWADAPSAEAVQRRDEERLLSDPIWTEPASETEAGFAAQLLQLYTPDQIAAAYVRLYKGNRSAPEELAASGSDTGQRPAFGPSKWFSVSVGRDQNAEPRWILPMLCRSGNISRDDVGAIRVQDSETFVEVLEASAGRLLAAVGPSGKLEGDAVLRALAQPPFGMAAPAAARVARAPRPEATTPEATTPEATTPEAAPRAPLAAKYPAPKPPARDARPAAPKDFAAKDLAPKTQAPKPAVQADTAPPPAAAPAPRARQDIIPNAADYGLREDTGPRDGAANPKARWKKSDKLRAATTADPAKGKSGPGAKPASSHRKGWVGKSADRPAGGPAGKTTGKPAGKPWGPRPGGAPKRGKP